VPTILRYVTRLDTARQKVNSSLYQVTSMVKSGSDACEFWLSVGFRPCRRQGACAKIGSVSSIAEIENAIEKLPAPQVDELAGWLERLRAKRATPAPVENWLQFARGAARSGETTAKVMTLTRGEE
jgi:hypothetical protein